MVSHLTQDEVAERLNISPRTLERWRQAGDSQVIPYLKVGSKVRYRLIDVEEFERRQLRQHTSQLAPYVGRPDIV